MELKELRYFRVIVECGSLSKAATLLHVAQPALSRQIRKLEHDLGVELLHRSAKGIVPTAAGTALLLRTEKIEHDVEAARREVAGYARDVVGALRIAVQYPFSVKLLPKVLERYTRAFPNVAIQTFDAYSFSITESLLTEKLDVAIVDMPSHPHADLQAIPLWVDTLCLVGPGSAADDPLFKGRTTVQIEEIAGLPIVMPTRASSLRRLADAAFAKHHIAYRPIIEADGQLMNFGFVEQGLGYTLFPRVAFRELELAGRLVALDILPAIRRSSCLLTRTEVSGEKPVAAFVEMVREGVIGEAGSDWFSGAVPYDAAPDRLAVVA